MPAEAKYAFTQFFSMPLDPSLVIFYRRHSPAAPRLRPASVASSSINHSCGQFQKLQYYPRTVRVPVVLPLSPNGVDPSGQICPLQKVRL